jgi:hypothetical protein
MPVSRCATDVSFPPSAGTCPTMVSSGIEVKQTSTFLPGGHQVRMRSVFRSLNGKRHTVRLDYDNHVSRLIGGNPGYRFPGQAAFHVSTAGETVTHLGHGAGTLLARDDMFGSEGDPLVATRAITWSRTPTSIHFSNTDLTDFGITYTLHVPKGGAARLGFTDSDAVRTSQARALGARGEADMMPAPRILTPADGAAIKGTKTIVTGVVDVGANGLPTSVTVNGHPAKLTVKGPSEATFKVTFDESLGKHVISALAKDGFGNTRSASVTVKNVKP